MDYEKKYKDALLRAKKLHDEPTGGTEKIVCEQIFPELRETADKQLDPDEVIAWMQSFGYDITTLVQSFKEHFGLN